MRGGGPTIFGVKNLGFSRDLNETAAFYRLSIANLVIKIQYRPGPEGHQFLCRDNALPSVLQKDNVRDFIRDLSRGEAISKSLKYPT